MVSIKICIEDNYHGMHCIVRNGQVVEMSYSNLIEMTTRTKVHWVLLKFSQLKSALMEGFHRAICTFVLHAVQQ